jgi:hypothetical protein
MTALHDLTIKAIRRAQSQGGVIDPVDDWAAISELDRLARAATEPPQEDKLVFLDLPLIVGNVSLYRLSWGALDWVADCAGVWYAEDGRMYDRALAWAHVNARSPRAFRRCAEKRIASAEISRWAREQTTPWQVITAGVDQLMSDLSKNRDKKYEDSQARRGNGPVFDFLIEAYHQPIEYWIWGISINELHAIIKAHSMKTEEAHASLDAQTGRAPNPDSALTRNTIMFQRAAKQFITRCCHE